jgi:hypothetical protein
MKSLGWEPYFAQRFAACSPAPGENVSRDQGASYKCFYSGGLEEPINIRVLGDSHAQHIFPGLVNALPASNIQLIMLDKESADDLGTSIEIEEASVTVVAGFWEDFSKGQDTELVRELSQFTQLGLRTSAHVLVLGDVPRFVFEAADCAFPAKVGPDRCSEAVSATRLDYAPIFREALKGYPNVDFVELRDLFCERGDCRFDPTGDVLYRDSNHLNPEGSDYVARRIVPHIQERLSRSAS